MQRVSPAFEAALSGSRDVAVRATVYSRDGDSLRIIHDIDDWSLHEDADAIPQGVLTLDVADPNYTLDVSNDNMHRWFSREIELEWGLYVGDRYEWLSLIRGPVAEVERDGALVHFRVTTRDAQNADPHFFRRGFSVRKHTRKSRVIELIAQERGERRLDIEAFPRRLARDRTWVPGQEPERAMRAQADDLVDAHLYLRGDGTRRLRRLPEQPSWTFVDGVNETIIAGNPRYRASIEPLRNMAIVRGERHYKKLVERHMQLDQKAVVGANSIHVAEAKGVTEGAKIKIGKGNFQETRTVSGSYTPGSETIPLVGALDHRHPVGAPVSVTVKEDRTKPVIGRAQLQQNHPLSSEVLTNGFRPRMKILDKPGIHKKDKADDRADQVIRRMSIGFETETGVDSLIVPHLELKDVVVVEHAQGFFRFRIQTRELSKSGTMTLNKRRRYTPKKPRVRGKGPKASVKRVRIETQGGILNQSLTNTWTDGASLSTEAVTDFSDLGGVIVFEPGTAREELAWYTSRNEWTDELVGVVRPGPRFSHAAGTFIQDGAEASIEKLFDGYIDDELTTAVGIPVPSSKFGYLSLATTEADEKVVQLEFDDNEELFLLEGPEGEAPTFDEDLQVLPVDGIADIALGEIEQTVQPIGLGDGDVPVVPGAAPTITQGPNMHLVDMRAYTKPDDWLAFVVEYSTNAGGAWTSLGDVGSNVFAHTNLTLGTNYRYRYSVRDSEGNLTSPSPATADFTARGVGTSDLVVGSVTATILASTITISNTFQTAASGSRVMFDGSGIRLINSSGTTVADLNASTGVATLIGSVYKSSTSGSRVELDSNGLRFYDSSNALKVELDTATSSAEFTGSVVTGTGARVEVSGANILVYSDASTLAGEIDSGAGSFNLTALGTLHLDALAGRIVCNSDLEITGTTSPSVSGGAATAVPTGNPRQWVPIYVAGVGIRHVPAY